MSKIIQFGENIAGYEIPVLNEREIRAAAGILFLATYTSLLFILFDGNFIPVKYVVTVFLLDLLIRVFINPKYSPLLIIGRLIVRKQTPEYVGAAQKKFAWSIGIVLSASMFYLLVIDNSYSVITGSVCMICLVFLFFETAFGICLGCKFYPLFFRRKVQYCPGEVCDVKSRQKVSPVQLLIVALLVGFVLLTVHYFHQEFAKSPHNLFR